MSESEPPASESGPPPGGADWIEPIHGDLVVVNRGRVGDWQRIERGMAPELEDTLVEGVVSTLDRGTGTALLLHTPDGLCVTGIAPTDDGLLIVTHLGGDGGPAVLEAARSVPADAFQATGTTLTFGIEGGLVFDGTASATIATEATLALEVPIGGELTVDVAAHADVDGHSLHVVRLRRV